MKYGIKLLTKTIQRVEFEIWVAKYVKVSKLLVNGEDFFIQDVDLAQIIRAVDDCDTLPRLRDEVKGIWDDEKLIRILNCVMGDAK